MTFNTFHSPKVYEYKQFYKEICSEWTNYSFTYSNNELNHMVYSELLINPNQQPKCNLIRTSNEANDFQLRLDYPFKEIQHYISLNSNDCQTIVVDYIKSVYWTNTNEVYPISDLKTYTSLDYLFYRKTSENKKYTIYKVIQPDDLHTNENKPEHIELNDEYTDLIVLPFKNPFIYGKKYIDETQYLYVRSKTTFESIKSILYLSTKDYKKDREKGIYFYSIRKINNKVYFEITDSANISKYYEVYVPVETIN